MAEQSHLELTIISFSFTLSNPLNFYYHFKLPKWLTIQTVSNQRKEKPCKFAFIEMFSNETRNKMATKQSNRY